MATDQEFPRVFISHSNKDKDFVRQFANDLENARLGVWLDDRQLKPGDSIVSGISEGLRDTDYLIIVLSKASVASSWVQAELNAALMNELSDKGTVVLPVLIEDCDLPILLRDRVFADFRKDYLTGLKSILRVLAQENETVSTAGNVTLPPVGVSGTFRVRTECEKRLLSFKAADLRRLVSNRLSRDEVSVLWWDTFEKKMDDDMSGRTLNECVIEMLDRARRHGKTDSLVNNLCAEYGHIGNP